ncbi:hypothetical protein N836_34675 [Leptolyngbya sp. Heron Island J]|uniref:hypothetical protein n=1 Tax=Leptolyngbya sp. Heron Island J TaxID=1385935 RepID=UPI0003B9693A|nr:hypothetical protein [Leptolyngbya sp. Heron Island J]ESA37940.1 hypothetical protein N836_34675 [Leptolyngbya sp. Heron Island J]
MVLDGDWLKGITLQTQELDFSDLVQRANQRDPFEPVADDESVVGDVDKASVLALVDALTEEAVKEQALAVAHSENVSVWIDNLSMQGTGVPQRLIDLQRQVKMPLVEVWMAALLGDFRLEQRGGFYGTEHLWIA